MLILCWWDCKLMQPLWKAVWRFFRKLVMEPTFDTAIPILGLHPKYLKSAYNSGTATSMITAAPFTIANLWNQTRCSSTDEWIKKLWCIYTMEHYSALNNEIIAFASKWMGLEDIMLREISPPQGSKGQMFSLI